MMRHIIWPAILLVLLVRCSYAQSCNPASLSYIVRDEKGTVVSKTELESIYEKLPKQIGDADTSVTEVSFAPDKKTFYWPEDVEWKNGTKVAALLFSNVSTCAMHLSEVTLSYHGKTMRLRFDVDISRNQDDRRPVVDSLRFQNGTFRLDLTHWTEVRDRLIPASHWKRIN